MDNTKAPELWVVDDDDGAWCSIPAKRVIGRVVKPCAHEACKARGRKGHSKQCKLVFAQQTAPLGLNTVTMRVWSVQYTVAVHCSQLVPFPN